MKIVLSASVGWSRGSSILSKSIQWADDSYFNHVYVIFDIFGIKIIVESLEHGIQWTPYDHLLRAKKAGKVLDFYSMEMHSTPQMRSDMYENALEIFGKGYDFWQILRYLVTLKVNSKAGRKRNNPKRFTCNEAVVKICRGPIQAFDGTDYSSTPEKLFKHLHDGVGSKEMFGKKEKKDARNK
jgi:hypothetical protein